MLYLQLMLGVVNIPNIRLNLEMIWNLALAPLLALCLWRHTHVPMVVVRMVSGALISKI